jgi:hypothetical protein
MTDPLTYLDEVDARVADCSTYNFGMRNADGLAHVDAPALSKALRAAVTLPNPHPPTSPLWDGYQEALSDIYVQVQAALAVNDEGGK